MTKEQKEKALAFLKDMQECTYDGVEEIRTAIKCLEQPTSDDCVSRQAVLDKKVLIELPDGQKFYSIDPEDIKNLPPVTPTHSICKECKYCEDIGVKGTLYCKRYGINHLDGYYCADFEKRGDEE